QNTSPELWIIGNGLAPSHITSIAETDDLGDIKLEPGTALTGILQSRDAKPISNCVVVLESVENGDVQGVHFPVTFAAQTDAQGQFRFRPARGDYRLYVAQASRTDEILPDRFVVSDNPPPFVVPQRVSLDGKAKEMSVQLNAVA